jgi:RimJ/RimL family protein N-acetyltransferase
MVTDRLLIRMMRRSDAGALAEYRDLPEVAAMQLWDLPYTEATAVLMLAGQDHLDGPTPGEWVQLAIEHDGAVVGDLACHVRAGGGVAEIGYTLHPRAQGRGFASEAAAALVDELIAHHGIHRIIAELDPQNVASMRVLEAIGMTFESLTEASFLWRGVWVDNLHYAMTAADRAAWVARPRARPERVELVEITAEDAHVWGRLRTHHSQERFVSPMAKTFRDALFPEAIDGEPLQPWMRGVLADGEPAAFLMLSLPHHTDPRPFLWRFLVDRTHQRRGIGELAMAALMTLLAEQGHTQMLTSWEEGAGGPRPFYERLGFRPTGDLEDGETVAVADLSNPPPNSCTENPDGWR